MRWYAAIALAVGIAIATGVWLLHTLYLDVPIEIAVFDKTIVTSLTVAIMTGIIAALAIGLLLKMVSMVLFFPSHFMNWRVRRIERKRSSLLASGIRALAIGDQAAQHKSFAAAAEAGVEPALTYYMAAAAADQRRKEALLRRAASAAGDPIIKAMAEARSKLSAGRPADAAEILRLAGAGSSSLSGPLLLLLEACEQSGDLRGALDAAQRLLGKQPAQPALRARAGALTRRLLADARSPDEVRALIGTVSKGRSPSSVAAAAASRLAAVRDEEGASAILSQALKHDVDAVLLEATAEYGSDKLVEASLKRGEELLAQQPDDADAHRAFGRLAMRSKLWGQARKAFERAVELQPDGQNYHSLAELAEKEGKSSEEVNRLYRRAADTAAG